jgi:ferritin
MWVKVRVQSSAMKEVFDELVQREHELTRQIQSLAGSVQQRKPEDQIDQLMQVVENLQDLAKNTDDLFAVGQLFGQLNLQLFFQFQQVQLKKRLVNRVAGGQVTFGNASPPVELYTGLTDTQSVKAALYSVKTL